MVTKVNGGIPESYQNATGSLSFFTVACTAATFTTGDYGVPDSQLDKLIRCLSTRGTVVIARVKDADEVYIAMENAQSLDKEGDGTYEAMETLIEGALGIAADACTITAGSFAVA